MSWELNRLKCDGEEIQIVGSVHVDCDWDKDTGHGVNIGFVTYKQLIGELIGTMKYRCEITLKRKPVCISMMFFKFETYYRYQ